LPSTVLKKFPAVDLQLATRDIGGRIRLFQLAGGFAGMACHDIQINTPSPVQRFDVHPSIEIPVLRSNLLT
jgi:hypothetical protein